MSFKKSIFIIDDSDMDRWLAQRIIELHGFSDSIETAANGIKGIRKLQEIYSQNHRLPDLILVDLQMPLMDGFSMIEEIRSIFPNVENESKIVLISAGLDDGDLERIKKLEIKNILSKPLDKEQLQKFIIQS